MVIVRLCVFFNRKSNVAVTLCHFQSIGVINIRGFCRAPKRVVKFVIVTVIDFQSEIAVFAVNIDNLALGKERNPIIGGEPFNRHILTPLKDKSRTVNDLIYKIYIISLKAKILHIRKQDMRTKSVKCGRSLGDIICSR